MKKILTATLFILVIILLLMSLASCGSTSHNRSETVDCAFSDSRRAPAPLWVCDRPVDGLDLSAVGSAEESSAGFYVMKKRAAARAGTKLTQNFRSRLEDMLRQYVQKTDPTQAENIPAITRSVTEQIKDQKIARSRLYKTITGPEGDIYVLMGLNKYNFQKLARNTFERSMTHEPTLWRPLKKKLSFPELARNISQTKEE
ncbi:MAG: hypothetical protein ACTSXQ_01525 [Alphaproteobacteria bacterium]